MKKLTREQAAVIGAFTGYLVGPFSDMHGYVEGILGRPVWTHEFASEALSEEIQKAAKPDFMLLAPKEDG